MHFIEAKHIIPKWECTHHYIYRAILRWLLFRKNHIYY